MDRSTRYVVVEGVDDIPKYENAIRSLSSLSTDFVVIDAGGKTEIISFCSNWKGDNFVAILDQDFDDIVVTGDVRLIYLDRYCIENYIIDEDTIGPFLSMVSSAPEREAIEGVNFQEWANLLSKDLDGLYCIIRRYQQNHSGSSERWSGISLLSGATEWSLDRSEIAIRFSDLLATLALSEEEVINASDERIRSAGDLISRFPGKMLSPSLYRFLKEKCENIRPGRFRRHVGNQRAFVSIAASFLHRNIAFQQVIGSAVRFINA